MCTCRRLREVALNHPLLWRDVRTDMRSLVPSLLERSRNTPLRILACLFDDFQELFKILKGNVDSRLQELHITSVGSGWQDEGQLFAVLNNRRPLLHALSVQLKAGVRSRPNCGPLILSKDDMPSLRLLALSAVPFTPRTDLPTLTHIAISDPVDHTNVVKLLSCCPYLEDFFLSGEVKPPVSETLCDTTPLSLPPLRKVTFRRLGFRMTCRYMILLGCHSPTGAPTVHFLQPVKPLSPEFTSMFLFPHRHIRLCVEIHPDRNGKFTGYEHALSLTTSTLSTSPEKARTRRVGEHAGPLRVRGVPPHSWFATTLYGVRASTPCVREVWLCNMDAYPWPQLGGAATLLPTSVEMVVLLTDTAFLPDHAPSLHALPRADEASQWPRLKTVRIVQGGRGSQEAEVKTTVLDLQQLLKELASGDYAYLEQLVLQTTPLIDVREEDVEQMRVYIQVVRFEQVEVLPKMLVHGPEDDASWGPNCNVWELR